MSLLSAPWQVSLAFSGITMGRHVAFATSAADEESLLQFLRASTDIQIFASFAPSSEELQVDGLAPYGPNAMQYAIWNKKYAWKPKYGRVDPEVGGHGGWFFVENTDQGPVIKLSRTNIEGFLQKDLATHQYGGIWWGAYNRQQGFAKWFDAIVRWIRKNGQNLCPELPFAVYCMPDAWQLWQARRSASGRSSRRTKRCT